MREIATLNQMFSGAIMAQARCVVFSSSAVHTGSKVARRLPLGTASSLQARCWPPPRLLCCRLDPHTCPAKSALCCRRAELFSALPHVG